MEKNGLSEKDNKFFNERLESVINAYQDMDFVDSMYFTYKEEDSKPVLEVVLIFDCFSGESALSIIIMGEFYDPMDKERQGALFKLVMDDSRNYQNRDENNESLNALYSSNFVVFDKSNLLYDLLQGDSKSTSSTEFENGPIKRIGKWQHGC